MKRATQWRTVVVRGRTKGHRSAAVVVNPDGSMFRGDVRLDLGLRLRNIAEAAAVVGMSRTEFIAARDELRNRSPVR